MQLLGIQFPKADVSFNADDRWVLFFLDGIGGEGWFDETLSCERNDFFQTIFFGFRFGR
jgi:hypothetical protein